MDAMIDWLVVAALFALVTLPAATWVLIRQSTVLHRISQRNAAQAVTIAKLEEMLRERGLTPVVRPAEGGGAEIDWRWAAQDGDEPA